MYSGDAGVETRDRDPGPGRWTGSGPTGRVLFMARDVGGRRVTELIAAVAANVAAVPVVLGFVALGGMVLAGRAVADVASHALTSRNGRRRARKAATRRPTASR